MRNTSVTLTWYGPYRVEQIERNEMFNELDGIYMLLDGKYNTQTETWSYDSILYIGMTYHQSFRKEINQTLDREEIQNCLEEHQKNELLIKIGLLTEIDQVNISQKLVQDIEALLIISNQPVCNTQNKESYSGRALVIYNTGRRMPLEEVISTDELV